MADSSGILGGGVGLAAGLIGHFSSQGDQDKANQILQDAYEQIKAVGAPPDLSKAIILEKFQQAGMLTPALEQTINAAPSEVAKISENASLQKAQETALQQLQQRGQSGVTPEEMAQRVQAQMEAQREAQAKNSQILQGMQQKGMGGSGSELAAQLQSSQSGANQALTGGLNANAAASQAALQAIGAGGNLAGSMRAQDFNVANTKGQAADQMNRFNVSNQIAQQQRNVGAQNQAQQYNLTNEQNISNANVTQGNTELERQNAAKRQLWLDQMSKAQATAGAMLGQASGFQNQANQTGAFWNGIGTGVGNVVSQIPMGGGSSAPSGGGAYNYGSGGGTGPIAPNANTQYTGPANYSKGGLVKSVHHYENGQVTKAVHQYSEGGKVSNEDKKSIGERINYPGFAKPSPSPKPKDEDDSQHFDNGGLVQQAMSMAPLIMALMKNGGKVPGKEVVPGDSYKNDIVDAKLSAGEIVIPKTIAPYPEKAKRFVEEHNKD